jgi:hypothetical protein
MRISFTELKQILADEAELKAVRRERDVLRQQVVDLMADRADTLARVQAVLDQSETLELKMRSRIAVLTQPR